MRVLPLLAAFFASSVASTQGASPAVGVSCVGATSVSLTVSWPAVEDTDMYYVALSETAGGNPFLAHTVEAPGNGTGSVTATVDDLLANHPYWVTVRSHPRANRIVWGWRSPVAAAILCATKPEPRGAPRGVARVGNAAAHEFSLTWLPPAAEASPARSAGPATNHTYSVGVRLVARELVPSDTGSDTATRAWSWSPVPPGALEATIRNLPAASTMEVTVRTDATGVASDPVLFRTTRAGSRYNTLYRISEYTFDIDFLQNHNSADLESMGIYVYHGTPFATWSNWPGSTAQDWDRCQAYLEDVCGDVKGTGLSCMKCPDAHRDDVVKVCGNFTDNDNEHEGFSVHFFCGIGWPESVILNSSITEYCVENVAPSAEMEFAQYVSCNSDETDWFGNLPRDPICLCWVYDDRMISQEPASKMKEQCGDFQQFIPWVHSPQCNCSVDSPVIPPSDASYKHVGRSDVWLPYQYYLRDQPRETYPAHTAAGYFYSTPRAGACGPQDDIGDGGCTWKRWVSGWRTLTSVCDMFTPARPPARPRVWQLLTLPALPTGPWPLRHIP